jgi:2-keto-4-pentenoate hydratase/2-oxohepta-3-ene-1,7-dioic acid hydratase in catechol pathway
MKLASYLAGGQPSFGVVHNNGIIDIPRNKSDAWPDLRTLIESSGIGSLAEIMSAAQTYALDDVTFVPPIPNPRHIFCVGLNYKAHAAEAGLALPEFMSVFSRAPTSLVGHGQPMEKTSASNQYDFEGELAVIIGKPGRYIAKDAALGHVAGYTCFNDGSIRDFQKHSVTAGKNFYRSGAFGPWIVTANEITDPGHLTLTTRLNGKQVQHSNTDDLIHDVSSIIAYLSTITELLPGDVIATGTPEGVGLARKPQLWMKPGDTIEVEIERIGSLSNPVVAEKNLS